MIVPIAFLMMAAPPPAGFDPPEAPTGSRIPRAPDIEYSPQDDVRRTQMAYGKCVVARRHKDAARYVLAADLEKAEFKSILPKIGDSHCLEVAHKSAGQSVMTFKADSMRYTLADALMRSEYSTAPLATIRAAGPIEHRELDETDYTPGPNRKASSKELEQLANQRAQTIATIYVSQFGECVVRAEPEKSFALLMADPVTDAATAAISALVPSLGPCVIEGQNVKFDRPTLRGTIAMNYYRLAHAAPAPQPAEGATH